MAKKAKMYRVQGFVRAWVEVEVPALSLEDALAAARTLAVDDFLTYKGDCNDNSLQILGVNDEIPDV